MVERNRHEILGSAQFCVLSPRTNRAVPRKFSWGDVRLALIDKNGGSRLHLSVASNLAYFIQQSSGDMAQHDSHTKL